MGIRTARVVVVVNVNPDGSVKSEYIQTSAGISAIDYAALVAARQSTYSPKTVDCRPVLGTYLFEVTVSSQ